MIKFSTPFFPQPFSFLEWPDGYSTAVSRAERRNLSPFNSGFLLIPLARYPPCPFLPSCLRDLRIGAIFLASLLFFKMPVPCCPEHPELRSSLVLASCSLVYGVFSPFVVFSNYALFEPLIFALSRLIRFVFFQIRPTGQSPCCLRETGFFFCQPCAPFNSYVTRKTSFF